MKKSIAILRGINVGGRKKILMTDLRVLFASLGFSNIETYIQSGNVIFSTKNTLAIELAEKIEKAIIEKYKFDVRVIIRHADELEQAISNNPFYKKDINIDNLYLTFLKEKPTETNLLKIKSFNSPSNKFTILKDSIFVFCAIKYHKSKLTNNFFENKLGVTATTRNWRTVLKISELSRKQ